MKKLVLCLTALTLIASCAKFGKKSEVSANKYSEAKKEETSPKKEVKAEKKAKKEKVKKHGGSEVK